MNLGESIRSTTVLAIVRDGMIAMASDGQVTVGDVSKEKAAQALKDAGLTVEMADDIYYLTALAKFEDRFVIPAAHREQAIEMMEFTGDKKGNTGFGFKEGTAERGL